MVHTLHTSRSDFWHAEAMDILTEIDGDSIDLVWTDPPYGLPMTHNGEFGFHLADDFKTTDASAVMTDALEQCVRVLAPLGEIFCCIAGPSFGAAYATLERCGIKALRTITWDKGSASPTFPGFAWKNQTEIVIYGAKGIDGSWKTHGGTPSIIRANRCAGRERVKGDDGKSLHPTQKPLALIDACLANTRAAALVELGGEPVLLDPFAGVGSACVAALRAGMRTIGTEKDEAFALAAIERLTEEN